MESVRESICKSCANKRICSSAMLEARNSYMTGCSRFEKAKPQTNADKIRRMSDEELAEFIETLAPSGTYQFFLNGKTWGDWLKQEVIE